MNLLHFELQYTRAKYIYERNLHKIDGILAKYSK